MNQQAAVSPAEARAEGLDDGESSRELLLIVGANGSRIALPVADVREVHKGARSTAVPGAPPVLWGIANVRGAIVTVLDLGVSLAASMGEDQGPDNIFPSEGAGERAADRPAAGAAGRGSRPASIVILEHDRQLFGVRVDSVFGVVVRDEAPIVPTALSPWHGTGKLTSTFLSGTVVADGTDVPLLDVGALCMHYLIPTE